MDRRVEAGEMDATILELQQNSFNVIGPGRGGIPLNLVEIERFTRGKRSRGEFDFRVLSWRSGDVNISVNREGHDQPRIVISVIAEQLEPSGRAHHMRRRRSESGLKKGFK